MTVIDYTGSLKLNENAKQGLMAAQEENANNAASNAVAVDEDDDSNNSCSKITSVNEYDCARFNLVNDIR